MYQALYRKWRPRTFEEVVGQEHITTTLKNEMIQGKPAHAYLLMGSRGTGKTTCAKLIAKAVNCRNPVDGSPCGQCDCCRGVDNGSLVDVVEIDAASNNGVDNIRDLREEAVFLPNIAKYRVYIIDEAHMLSVGAVNALLKIMEEPPEHVIFILATTEVHKIPATIQSRCQRFDFKRIAPEVIRDRLLFIAGQEDMTLTEEAAALIARIADGGMRDALSLLDLCWAHAHDITVETVSEAAGLVGQDYLFEIADAAGHENEIIFGMLTPEVNALKGMGYHPNAFINGDNTAMAVLDFLEKGWNGENFSEVTSNLRNSDPYMVMADFKDYRRAQHDLQELYRDKQKWNHMSLKNISNAGIFSADRSIMDYARDIWGATPVK